MALIAYPDNWTDGAQVIVEELPKMVSGSADKPKLVRGLYHVAGYGIGRFYPDGGVTPFGTGLSGPAAFSGGRQMTDSELVETLKTLNPEEKDGALSAIDWRNIIATILPLLIKILLGF